MAASSSVELVSWILLALLGLGSFLWCVGSGQFQDLESAARLPLEDDDVRPTPPENRSGRP
jgi:cbb3-type cytochrome oxidase maturation protein